MTRPGTSTTDQKFGPSYGVGWGPRLPGRGLCPDLSSPDALDNRPERVSLDGARTSYESDPEQPEQGYADAWLTADDRVLALHVLRGFGSCASGGPFGYTTGSGGCTTVEWTQLVATELGSGEPVEVGYAEFRGGPNRSGARAVERADGTYLSAAQSGWFHGP